MKTICSIILLSVATMLVSSCVSRTVTTDAPLGEEGTVVERKLIWFWQDEFRHP